MGSEFADRNPRAAADIVFKALPTTKANYGPRAGTESLMQIHRTFKGDMTKRAGLAGDLRLRTPLWQRSYRLITKIEKLCSRPGRARS